jgi:hypothetical protein
MEIILRFRRYAVTGVPVAACLLGLAALAAPGAAQAATTSAPSAVGQLPAVAVTPSRNLPQPSGAEGCAAPTSPLMMQCQSIVVTSAKAETAAKAAAAKVAAARAKGESPAATVSSSEPLTPADLQAAYGLTSASSSDGHGETVAIVDAYYDPNANSDLQAYRNAFGLLACGSNSTYPEAGCLNAYNQSGTNLATDPSAAPPQSPSGDNWDPETSLDLDMVSAICPNCTIDLIEANSDNLPDLATAEDTAVSLGAKFVSNSWSGGDYPGESSWDSYFNHPGVAIAFASGDYGYGASYPASSQFVTSVGGTFLGQNSSGNWTSTVWNDNGSENVDGVAGATASGCSAGEPQPSWGPDSSDSTSSSLCANRTQNDVSAVADAQYGTDIYDSADCTANGGNGNCDIYGTSVATPIITAMYALAGTPAANTYPASYLYKDPSGLTPVTSGSDVASESPIASPLKCESNRLYLCNAGDSLTTPYSGYNGPAGLGTLNGNLAPFKNNATDNVVSVANPGTYDLQRGVNVTLSAVKAIDSASGQTLTYSATGLPAGLSINSSTGVISGNVVNIENDTVHVTAKDSTGASATVSYRIEASNSMTASYHAGTGQVKVDVGGKCMDDTGNSSSNGARVQTWTCISGDAGQVWSFQPDTAPGELSDYGLSQTGTIRIHGKCLNIVNNGTANGSKIQLWSCNGGANEEWAIAGQYGALYNPVSGKCLEDPGFSTKNGTQLDIWTCNPENGNNQNWLLPASPFDSAISSMCINDAGNSAANGAKIISYTCNGGSNEKLQVPTAGPYALLVVNGKCLNATGNGTVNGTPIQLYSCANSSGDVYSANLWYLTAYGQIENAQAQKCLAIPNNSPANSTRLELEDCYGEPGEVWAAS